MLGPIALYPDPLLAQLFPATTLPAQVVLADRYVRQGGDLNQVDAQPWDNSIKALARYPATLRMLDDNLAWTTQLGQAFLSQPADVMDSVQRLRARARALGNLQSTAQQTVLVSDGLIEIVPARPEVIVWRHDHPRPAEWWYRVPVHRETHTVVNNLTVVDNSTVRNHDFTVWHPRANNSTADHGDRSWDTKPALVGPAPRQNETASPGTSNRPKPSAITQPHSPAPAHEVLSAPSVLNEHPGRPEVQRPLAHTPNPRVKLPAGDVKPMLTSVTPSHEVRVVSPRNEKPSVAIPPHETGTARPSASRPAVPAPKPALTKEPSPAIGAPKHTAP
jgi:hypothetical protein